MASAMTDWGTGQFLQICLNIIDPPDEFFVALANDEPGNDIDGIDLEELEPDPLLGYTRVSIPTGAGAWSVSDEVPYSTNVDEVAFPMASADWGTYNHFVLCSEEEEGEVYVYGEFDNAPEILAGEGFIIPIGGIVIAFGSFTPSIVAT